ncbi:MAG: cold-shock protein [Rhodobacteraceae bacterium]|nr:cold-shock protein [Paracoccaceae bacterium]
MAKGTVKWFNADKGYGFIQPADGGKDIFVHISQVQSSGLMGLTNDQPVEFELIDGLDGRQMAGNISVAE